MPAGVLVIVPAPVPALVTASKYDTFGSPSVDSLAVMLEPETAISVMLTPLADPS